MVHIVCDFSDVVVIRVKGKHFKVPRDILTTTSVFFDEELSYGTPLRFFLTLDDIDAELFNTYINVLLKSACSAGFRIRRCNNSPHGSWIISLEFLFRLWQLGRRFNSYIMCLLTEEALMSQYFAKFTTKRWQMAYVKSTEVHIRQVLLALQQNYIFCKDDAIRLIKSWSQLVRNTRAR